MNERKKERKIESHFKIKTEERQICTYKTGQNSTRKQSTKQYKKTKYKTVQENKVQNSTRKQSTRQYKKAKFP